MGTLNAIVGPTIYAVEDFTSLGNKLRLLFSRFDSGEFHAVTSELSLAETLVKPTRDGNSKIRDTYDRMLRSTASLTVMPIGRDILVDAARLRAASALKLPDAIHVATSFSRACSTFLTNDLRLETISGLPVLTISKLP